MNKNNQSFKGNILLFYSYDIGNDIDLEMIRKQGLVNEKLANLSSYFKNYNVPLSFELPERRADDTYECEISKVYHFGVLSFCFKVSFEDTLENLKPQLIEIHNIFKRKSDINAKIIFDKIKPAVANPAFYQLKNSYYVVNVIPPEPKLSPDTFTKSYGDYIASLLRLETQRLSIFQRKEIFSATTGYSGDDLLIIDSEGSLIYDDEYKELLEFFELATIKQLQLQYYDMFLDKQLEGFYSQPYKVPFRAYVPLLAGRIDPPAQKLARLRVDISVITERLDSSINMAGDAYFSHVYSMLEQQLSLKVWKSAINNKLDIIKDLYTVHQNKLEVIHAEMLEVIIVVLIAMELAFELMKR